MTPTKAAMYKTAIAKISCAKLKQGDYVSVKFSHITSNGTLWFEIAGNQNGNFDTPIMYPEHHLERFCL